MKYIDEFRDKKTARVLARAIEREVKADLCYRLMEFCGGHTHAISRYGLEDLLPERISLIHGPGCPVCVLPVGRIDSVIRLALENEITLCTYADTMRIPASDGLSLFRAKAQGADVRMVYSGSDALRIAQENPGREVVFFAIGFETTTPPTAVIIKEAEKRGLGNFSVFCCHVLTPPAMTHLMELPGEPAQIDGFIGPAHVSTIIGTEPYEAFVRRYQKPVVIAGFEPLDVMQSILMLVCQLNEGRCEVENQFIRAVTQEGNRKAQQLVDEVFELRETFEWRGLGDVPDSALKIREAFSAFDAEKRFSVPYRRVPDPRACECAAVLCGQTHPGDCRVFGSVCTPDTPIGACMVSSEGACAAYYTYGRFRQAGGKFP